MRDIEHGTLIASKQSKTRQNATLATDRDQSL